MLKIHVYQVQSYIQVYAYLLGGLILSLYGVYISQTVERGGPGKLRQSLLPVILTELAAAFRLASHFSLWVFFSRRS